MEMGNCISKRYRSRNNNSIGSFLKCQIRIPLEILSELDPKMLNFEQETRKLSLFYEVRLTLIKF